MGRGYLSYSRHPQTVPLYHHLWQFAAQQHGWEMDQFHSIYGIVNLVLHSNFDSYMFCLLVYFYYIKGLIHLSRNRNKSIFNICTHCTGCTDYRYWYLMTGTLCESVTIWSGRPQGGRRGEEVWPQWTYVDNGGGVKNVRIFRTSFMDGPLAFC